MMNEIDDHLDDSDDDDTSYMINANASTGGADKQGIDAPDQLAHSYYPEEKGQGNEQDSYAFDANQNYNTNTQGYGNNYSNQYNNGTDQDYQKYAQAPTDSYATNNYQDNSATSGQWDQQWQ